MIRLVQVAVARDGSGDDQEGVDADEILTLDDSSFFFSLIRFLSISRGVRVAGVACRDGLSMFLLWALMMC